MSYNFFIVSFYLGFHTYFIKDTEAYIAIARMPSGLQPLGTAANRERSDAVFVKSV